MTNTLTSSSSSGTGFGDTRFNLPKSHPSVHIHCDYLRMTCNQLVTYEQFTKVKDLLGGDRPWEIIEDEYFSLGKGAKSYTCRAAQPTGIRFLYTKHPNEETGEVNYDVVFEMTGRRLSTMQNYDLWQLCVAFKAHGFSRCTRWDTAVDDYENPDLLRQVEAATEAENCTGFKKFGYYKEGEIGKGKTGETFTLGSRQSSRFVRIYDAKNKHGIDAIRWEQENKRKVAQEVFDMFVQYGRAFRQTFLKSDTDPSCWEKTDDEVSEALGEYMGKMAVGHLDFVDRSEQRQNGQVSDLEKLPFWQNFIDRIGGQLKVVIVKPKPTLQKTIDWLERQCVTGLAMTHLALGKKAAYERYQKLLSKGLRKMTKYQELMVEEYRNPCFIEPWGLT